MLDVSIDIETLGTSTDAAVATIGAVQFNRTTGKIKKEFYERVLLDSALKFGKADGSTLRFWLKQPDEAREEIAHNEHGARNLKDVLDDLHEWFPKSNCCVWANSPSFDLRILETAFKRTKTNVPWRFWHHRCFRTIKDIGEELGLHYLKKPEDGEVLHNALDDAKRQAAFITKVYAEIGF